MLVLVCVSGLESAELVRHVLERTGVDALQVALLYVIDTRPPEEVGYVRRAVKQPVAAGAPPPSREALEALESTTALEVLAEASAALEECGVEPERIRRFIARGRPQDLIVAHAVELGSDLVAIGSRHRGAPVSVPAGGPPSIGPVARHVLDHVPCDVLLLR